MLDKPILYKENNVAIIVTTYNPNINDFENAFKTYAGQAALVVIVDNSTSKNNQLEQLCTKYENVHFISMQDNLGIAKAQNFGTRYAIDNDYELFIEIDQDSSLPNDYVRKILFSYNQLAEKNIKVAGIGPLAMREDGFFYGGRQPNIGPVMVDKTHSSGFLFNKHAFDVIGSKNEGLFIDFVDWEWCWRAKHHGFDVFVDTSVWIEHKLGNGHKKIFFWEVGVPAPIRHYYQYRNSCLISSLEYVPLTWKVKRAVIHLLKIPIFVLFFDKPFLRVRYALTGIKDCFVGRYGRIDGKF